MMGVPGKKADNCMVAEKQREERLGSNMTDFLPLGPTSSKFYAFLLIVPQAGDQAFNTWAFEGYSRSELCIYFTRIF
jgi:hypothetical protein